MNWPSRWRSGAFGVARFPSFLSPETCDATFVIGPVAAPNVDCAKAMIAPLLDVQDLLAARVL